jgi:hypothetical protein
LNKMILNKLREENLLLICQILIFILRCIDLSAYDRNKC